MEVAGNVVAFAGKASKEKPRLDYPKLIESVADNLLQNACVSTVAIDLYRIANEIRKESDPDLYN